MDADGGAHGMDAAGGKVSTRRRASWLAGLPKDSGAGVGARAGAGVGAGDAKPSKAFDAMTREEKAAAVFGGVFDGPGGGKELDEIPPDEEPLNLPPLASDEQALLDDDVPYYMRGRAASPPPPSPTATPLLARGGC